MKAKDYYRRFLAEGKTDESLGNIAIAIAMFHEIGDAIKARHVTTDAGLITVVVEQNGKWKSFVDMVNEGLDEPFLKQEGFMDLVESRVPGIGKLIGRK